MKLRTLALMFGLALLLGAGVDDATQAGQRAWQKGDYATALHEWSMGLQIARGENDPDAEFDLLLRIAAVNRVLGRLDVAGKTLELAKPKARTEPQRARLSGDQGALLLAAGDLRKAEAAFTRAFTAFQKSSEAQGAANAALNLGITRNALGKTEEATKALNGAETLFSALSDRGGSAAVHVELARVDRRTGALGTSLERLDAAIGDALMTGDMGTIIDAQLLRGTVLRELGRPEQAKASYLAGLDAAKKRRDVAGQARLYNALGSLLHARGDARARGYYRSAEEGFESLGNDAAALAVAVNAAMLDGFDPAETQKLMARAEAVGDPRLRATLALNLAARGDSGALKGVAGDIEALGLADLKWRYDYLSGRAALESGRQKDGIRQLEAAVDELERRRRSLDSGDSRPFVTQHEDVYNTLIDALLAAGEKSKAFAYGQRLQLQDVPAPKDPRLATLIAEEAYLSDGIAAAKDPEQRAALAKRLATLRVEFANTVDTLRSSYDDFDRMVRMDPEDLEAIQAQLDPGVTVLQPLLFNDRVALLVFSRDRLEAKQVEIESANVHGTIKRLSRSLQAAHTRDLAWTQQQADDLGRWFIAPIADSLKGTKTLVVSATGALREIPFAMVRHEGRYLVEDMAVVGVTHVGSLSGKHDPFRMKSNQVLLVGNPDGSLPGAEAEIGRIRARLPRSVSLQGSQGTRAAFQENLAGKQVVHLATHGVIDRNRPNDSYLVLHGEGTTGRLSYREIPGLAPYMDACRLVVLSACQSGLAVDARRTTDEDGGIIVSINGLAAQFRRAGVETLIASLWRVDDEGTLALMTALYDELASGGDIGTSLQRAQLRMLAHDETAHPWYWGAFVVVGDWR